MIHRLVKLSIAPEHCETFLEFFDGRKSKIESFSGCHHVELWRDVSDEHIFFTYSHWESEDALDAYRKSDFFAETWQKTKSLFSGKPEAWSLDKLA